MADSDTKIGSVACVVTEGYSATVVARGEKILVAVFLGLASSAQLSEAQGLKGARMPGKILGRLTYLPGVNDRERWKVFLDIQPKLVGMSLSDVYNHFGKDPVAERDVSAVEYGLTQEPGQRHRKQSLKQLRPFFNRMERKSNFFSATKYGCIDAMRLNRIMAIKNYMRA